MAGAPERRKGHKLLWTASSYFGEGLPWSFLHQLGTEYLTAIQAPLEQVGYTSWLHLSTTLKFVWSPFVDLFGRKRTWLWVMQGVLGVGMLCTAVIAEQRLLTGFWLALAVLAVLQATHDIACDGFYMLGLDRREQALYSGVRVAAFRVAMLVGSGALVYLAGRTSWLLGFGAAGVVMLAVSALNAAILPNPPEAQSEVPRAQGPAWWVAYKSFFVQPAASRVLAFIFFHKLGDIMMFAMSKPLLRDIGIDTATRGVIGGVGLVVFIASTIAGGAVIARLGMVRCLVPMTYIQNLAIPLYCGMALWHPPLAVVVAIVCLEQCASGIGESAKAVFLLQRCRAAFSASHFAFATAVVALGSTVAGAFSGHLAKAVGLPTYFGLCFVASWPSLLLVLWVPRVPVEPDPG